MSDVFFSGLYVVHKVFMTNCFDEEVSELLTGEKIPRDQWLKGRMSSVDKYLSVGSTNNWFRARMQQLLSASGMEDLRFLSGETYTHTYKNIIRHNGGAIWETTEAFTVLNPRYDDVIASVNRLQQWCLANPEVAADLLDTSPKDVASAIESAFFTLDPANEGFDGGEGAEFAFCVLKTVADLMRYAKFRKCWAAYHTMLEPEGTRAS